MKLSIVTATYNRGSLLKRLYESIIKNLIEEVKIEWLIMNDGSTDNTKEIVKCLINENIINIKYYEQKNQGKMAAINNLIEYTEGEFIIECDSDDYFADDVFFNINEMYKTNKLDKIYGFAFLKYNESKDIMSKLFSNKKSTMFDLYYKEGQCGEIALVFNSKIRKKYKYKLEKNEKFITEARMHHEMDLDNQILCFNIPIMICEYQKDGYTKNITKQFIQNPYGYFEYFKEIFKHNTKDITIKKRLYIIKHYILFKQLSNQKKSYSYITGFENKILYMILYVPGVIVTKIKFKNIN